MHTHKKEGGHAQIQKVLSEMVQIDNVFFKFIFKLMEDRGSKYSFNWSIICPPVKRHYGPILNAGLVAL